jgi:hypothetical protein
MEVLYIMLDIVQKHYVLVIMVIFGILLFIFLDLLPILLHKLEFHLHLLLKKR